MNDSWSIIRGVLTDEPKMAFGIERFQAMTEKSVLVKIKRKGFE